MSVLPAYEIKKWKRLKRDNGLAFSGNLYHNGIYECSVILATTSITEYPNHFILEHLRHRYILFKSQEHS